MCWDLALGEAGLGVGLGLGPREAGLGVGLGPEDILRYCITTPESSGRF